MLNANNADSTFQPSSNDRAWRLPHQVYILRAPEFEVPTFKIGASSNPRKRCRAIQGSHSTPMEQIAAYYTGAAARDIERFWHEFFWPKRVATKGPYCREWFHLTEKDVRFFKHVSYRLARHYAQDGKSWWHAHGPAFMNSAIRRAYHKSE